MDSFLIFKVFGGIIFLLFFYFSHVFLFFEYEEIFNLSIKGNLYAFSGIFIGTEFLIIFVSLFISSKLYSVCYYIVAVFYSFGLNIVIGLSFRYLIYYVISQSFFVDIFFSAILPFAFTLYGLINAQNTKVKNILLKYPGFSGKSTIAHLSDIHLGAIYKKDFCQKIVNKLKELKPDIVVITGDMADGSLRVQDEWLSPFDTLTVPVLYITGNHEKIHGKKEMIDVINRTNIKYIGHSNYEYKGMNFIGVDFEDNLISALKKISKEPPKSGVPNIVLNHIPTIKPEILKDYNVFLFLAGHTHGGQIFPLQILVYFGNACFSGLYSSKISNNHIYVSSGVGTALTPMRTFSNSVIGMITIEG